ncbi:MAG: hypothetical protein IPI67_04590 [Myxococcales bacterium]|nr:hypothetical protein [Myxococcales bacterium]
MADEEYSEKNALLVAQLEAARLEGQPKEELVELVRELLELRLTKDDADETTAALRELEDLIGRDDPGDGVLLEYYAARAALARDDAAAALEHAERATKLAEEHELDEDLPHALDELAESLEALGRTEDAQRERLRAADSFEAAGLPTRAGFSYLRAARSAVKRAEPREARSLFRRAVTAAEQGEDDGATSIILHSVGLWHAERNEYLPARHAFERALELARRVEHELGQALCLEQLAWLEVEAFHHQAAISIADEALEAALDDWQRARALNARANARHRLHEHLAARADLLEAARLFEQAGEPEWGKDCRDRAAGDRLLHYLHYLPSWVFRHKDMSSREASMRREFQPFLLWIVAMSSLWMFGFTALAFRYPRGTLRKAVGFIATLPIGFLAFIAAVGIIQLALGYWRARRGE